MNRNQAGNQAGAGGAGGGMGTRGGNAGLTQQQQQQLLQQQQQQQQQQQHQPQQQQQQQTQSATLDQVIAHLFPPHLVGNQQGGLAHLQTILFPPTSNGQSPLLQQVMLLAQQQRLTADQMAQLKIAVALRNNLTTHAQGNVSPSPSYQQPQAQTQSYQQQGTSQPTQQQYQQLQHQAALQQQQQLLLQQQQQQPSPAQQQLQLQQQQQQQQLQQANLQRNQQQPSQGTQQPLPAQNATLAIQSLQQRVSSLETVLNREDVTPEQRAKVQLELDAARANLQRVVKLLLAAHTAGNASATASSSGAAGAGVGGVQAGQTVEQMQQAQRIAMSRKQAELAALQVSNATGGVGGYRTASPALTGVALGTGGVRGSPSLISNLGLPGTSPPGIGGSPAPGIGGVGKKLTKKAQLAADLAQTQIQGSGSNGAAGLLQAQQQAQQLALAQAQQAQGQGYPNSTTSAGATATTLQATTTLPASASSSSQPQSQQQQQQALIAPTHSITNSLSLPLPTPEAFPASRPTLSSGLANNPIVSTPAIIKHPLLGAGVVGEALAHLGGSPFAGTSQAGLGASVGGIGSTVGGGGVGGGAKGGDMREDSKGRTVSKRKVRELLAGVDPEERLDDEVEDLLLDISDDFIDSITRFGCQLAKHRKSDRLEVKDLALHLERSYGIKIPGFSTEDTRGSQLRRLNLAPGHAARVAAVKEAGRRR